MADLTKHWRALSESKWLGAWDLWVPSRGAYAEVRARIDSVSEGEATLPGGHRERKWVLHLVSVRTGKTMPPMLVSNKSAATLNRMFRAPTPRGVVGREITLYVDRQKRVRLGTGDVLTIRDESGSKQLVDDLRAAAPPPLDDSDFDAPAH